MKKTPELLLPAKDKDCLILAIRFGADAVYLGAKSYGLRANSTNFTLPELKDAIGYAHERGVKVYVTANIIARNKDIENAGEYFENLKAIGPDGILVADPGMLYELRRIWPDAPVHISTQAGNSNYATFMYWYEQGIRRVVCERLMTLDEIKTIRERIPDDMEIEAFVHGAMCISYSGRCLLSARLTGRDANLGDCTHPCRWKYALSEGKRPGEYFDIVEDLEGTYILNSKDLCMIDKIDELIGCGIDSFKIEGRMKSPLYAATLAKEYKAAIDECVKDKALYISRIPAHMRSVSEVTHRPYSHGFYYGDEGENSVIPGNSSYVSEYAYLGYAEDVTDDGYVKIHQKNKFSVSDEIEVLRPKGDNVITVCEDIKDVSGQKRKDAPHPGCELYVKLSYTPDELDVFRMKKE